jgi:DNA modification methylase
MMRKQGMEAPRGIQNGGDDWLVPVQVGYESENDSAAMAYLAADNKLTELGGWNEPALAELLQEVHNSGEIAIEATGFDADGLDELLRDLGMMEEPPQDQGAQVDRAAELQEKWQVQRGDVWQVGAHRVMCGDSTCVEDVDRLMSGVKADAVVTDPPYGVNYADKNKFLNAIARGNRIQTPIENDHGEKIDIQEMWKASFSQMSLVMSPGAVVYCFMPQGGDQMMMMMMMTGAGIEPRHELIWLKNNHVLGRADYAYKHEPILYAWKDGGHKFYGGFQTSILEFDKPLKSDLHPTTKPVELIERLIINSSQRGEVVYDPFLGSGTTIVACEQTGRIGYGMEIAPEYVAVTLERLSDMGLQPELVENKNPVSGVDGDGHD